MYITPGDLLSSARSAAFLKACKHFLDMMTITTAHSVEQYERTGYAPHLFKYDLWVVDRYTDGWDDYDPIDSGDWSAHLSWCTSHKGITPDQEGTFISSVFTGYSSSANLSAPVNVVYQSRTTLAHNLIMQFVGDTNSPPDSPSGWQYERPWDWLGLGLANGSLYTLAAPTGGGDVAIEGDTVVGPANPPGYAQFVGPPPQPDPFPPYYGNVFFRGRFGSFAFDYGVEGGFGFRI